MPRYNRRGEAAAVVFAKIAQHTGHYATQGHSTSPILELSTCTDFELLCRNVLLCVRVKSTFSFGFVFRRKYHLTFGRNLAEVTGTCWQCTHY